jgi:hypothetical protein
MNNVENFQNQNENLETPKTVAIEASDIENTEEGEISPEAIASISKAEKNIAEITAMGPEEITTDPEKLSKVAASIEAAKDWTLRIAAALAVGGAWANAMSQDIFNKAEQMRSFESFAANSPEGIAGMLMIATPILAMAALGYRAYKKFSKAYDAEQAAKAAAKS